MARMSLVCLVLVFLISPTASAEVARFHIQSRANLAGGKSFGLAGPYEKLVGVVYFEVDPDNSANRIITDIDYAPRNAAGKVEFHSDFFLIKPKDITRGNGTVLYEVSNRGRKGMLGYFNNAAGSLDPETEAEMGDGFLMQHGFTLLWLGWQFDPPLQDGRIRIYPPIATNNGTPITGLVRSEVIVSKRTFDHSLADRNHVAYPVANLEDPAHVMTVRDTVDGPRQIIPEDQWPFARLENNGSVVPDRTRVYLEGGFEPHKLYDIVIHSAGSTARRPRSSSRA